ALALEHGRGLRFLHIDDTGIETHAITFPTQRAPEDLERAVLFVEQARKEGRKIRRDVVGGRTRYAVAGRTDDRQRFVTHLMTQPKECREIGDMVGMQVTDGDQREVAR